MILFGLVLFPSLWIYSRPAPKLLGNFPACIQQVQNKADPNNFTFFVLGDIKNGTKTFEELVKSVSGDNPGFVVILGDFINEPIKANHKLFAYEIAEFSNKLIFFVVPGNHDISSDLFTIEDFRAIYGSDQFSFNIGQNLFIFLNVLPICNPDGQYISFLEKTLEYYSGRCSNTFIFMHIPPTGLINGVLSRELPNNEKFLDLTRRYKVNYVFTGDHHGYVKHKDDSTTFIVTGGGGDRLRGKHGHFFHLTRISVDNDDINETVIACKRQLEVAEQIERNIVVYLFPLLYNHYIISIILVILTLFYIVFYNVKLRKYIVKK